MKTKYKLIVDYGKPYEEIHEDKESLFNALLELENQQTENEPFPYCDITILYLTKTKLLDKTFLESEEDITEDIFKEYNFKKEKVGFLK